ncbi:hypothetical protein DFH07DRAFT_425026 [Mycena maculata]|uniref:F-box domain-containing protein n=1 Tax=Mycena maculata TaxID=230809 RepID=A0AAD7JBC9_9AGAR|nr:hypothetical protein DFH07DRAFT_425026 [Mycena maculata]
MAQMSGLSNDIADSIRSPFSKKFLEGGNRLSEHEMRIAAKVVDEGERLLLNLDAAMDKLAQQREAVREQVLQHKNAIRAFRRLPPEIISKILLSALPFRDPDDTADTPWYLGHICQYWREVALGIPNLWTDIVIMGNNYSMQKLETLLARSLNAPLKVVFWFSRGGDARLLQKLVDCAPRWSFASLFVSPAIFVYLTSVRGRIPKLTHLRINVVDYWTGAASADQSNPFEIAPALRDVAFEDLSGLAHPLVLPFGQLTRLKAVASAPAHVANLQRTPNLEVASIDISEEDYAPPGFLGSPIYLPSLRRLYVSSLSFLDQLVLPALEDLYIVDGPPEPLLALCARSGPSLRLQTLRIMWRTPAHIATILAACPTTQTLAVQIMESNDSVALLTGLTVGPRGCIGPNVSAIAFALDGGMLQQRHFLKMVESRWRVPVQGGACVRLRAIELLIPHDAPLSTSTVQRLERLRSEGLEVSILYNQEATEKMLDWRP